MLNLEKYKSTLGFVDLLFNILLGVLILYYLAQLLINDPDSKKVESVAQMIITLDWDPEIPHDMDLWVMDPLGNIVGYQNKQEGVISLERDDLGRSTDVVEIPGTKQQIVIKSNHEDITLRGVVPGEYRISVHFYRNNLVTEGLTSPTKITVRLIQVNPKYRVVYQKEVVIDTQGDEMAMFQFYLDTKDGITPQVLKITELPEWFVIDTKQNGLGRHVFKPNERSIQNIAPSPYESDDGGM